MRKLSEIEKTQLRGMTINERLYEVGLTDKYEEFRAKGDIPQLKIILDYIQAPDKTVDTLIDTLKREGVTQALR